MKKTALITGCSSGHGWNVVATMRRPDAGAALAH
jgi:NAD(P)-dependent dehydrogenase (short-subunit alcohol dehydrogenase family)